MSEVVILGDCLEVMPTLEAESVDAIVCDPPAGISFMSKAWDHDKGGRDQWIAWLASVMREGLRVLKPGGHALVWALPRTSHWRGMALEGAGFEVRDRITHLFGSGFPKSLDVSKAMDKARDDQPDARRVAEWLRVQINQWKGETICSPSDSMEVPPVPPVSTAGADTQLVSDAPPPSIVRGHPTTPDIVGAQILGPSTPTGSRASQAKRLIAAQLGITEDMVGFWIGRHGPTALTPTWSQWQQIKALLNLGSEMDAEVWRLNERKGTTGVPPLSVEPADGFCAAVTKTGWNPCYNKLVMPEATTDLARQWEGWGTALKPAAEGGTPHHGTST